MLSDIFFTGKHKPTTERWDRIESLNNKITRLKLFIYESRTARRTRLHKFTTLISESIDFSHKSMTLFL